jgi:hypothetical protein
MAANNIDVIRRKLATIQILLLSERDRCAKKASLVQTGQLATDQGKWEHESLLREMILYQQSADIVEAIVKGLI